MREIKFRAWDKTKRVMYHNGFHIACSGEFACTFGLYPSHQIELMQYTGLKDKNGKEIYEGDIFKIVEQPEEVNVVEFYDGHYALEDHGLHLNDWNECGEVIGNRFENPELLKR